MSCASRPAWLCCANDVVAVCRACDTVCCMAANWVRNESICSFCVRATSPDCIREVTDWPDDQVKASALREARDAFPHHPLVLLCKVVPDFSRHGVRVNLKT